MHPLSGSEFAGQDERSLWVHETDQHPNDKGQRILADAILRWLVQLHLAGR